MSNYIKDTQGRNVSNPINETNTDYDRHYGIWYHNNENLSSVEGNQRINESSDNYNPKSQRMFNNEPVSVVDTEYTNEYRSTVERLRTQTETYNEALEAALVPSIVPGMAIQPISYLLLGDEKDKEKVLAEQYIFQDHPVDINNNNSEYVFICNMIKFKANRDRRLLYDKTIHVLSIDNETPKKVAQRIYDYFFISKDKVIDGINVNTEEDGILRLAERIRDNIKNEYNTYRYDNSFDIDSPIESGIDINTGIESNLYNLYKLGYIHAFLGFINGGIVPWTDIIISVDNKDVFVTIRLSTRYKEFRISPDKAMDILFTYIDIPFKVDYIKLGQDLDIDINKPLSKYKTLDNNTPKYTPIFLIERGYGAVFSDKDFKDYIKSYTNPINSIIKNGIVDGIGYFDKIYTDDPHIIYEEVTMDPYESSDLEEPEYKYALISKLGKLYNYRFVDYDYRCKLKKFNFMCFEDNHIRNSRGILKDDFDIEWHQFNILNVSFNNIFNKRRRFKVFYNTRVLYDQDNILRIKNKNFLADEFEKYRRSITANIEVFMKELYSLSKKDIGRYINTVNGELYEYKTPYEMAELFDVVKDMDKLKQQSQFSYKIQYYYLYKYGAFVNVNKTKEDFVNKSITNLMYDEDVVPIDINAYNTYEYDARGCIIPALEYTNNLNIKVNLIKEYPESEPDKLKIRYELAHMNNVEEGATPLEEFIYYNSSRSNTTILDAVTNHHQSEKKYQGANLLLKELSSQIFKDEYTPDEVRIVMNNLIDRMEKDATSNKDIVTDTDTIYNTIPTQMYNYGRTIVDEENETTTNVFIDSEWMMRRHLPEMFKFALSENMAVTNMDILDEVFDFTYNDKTNYIDNLKHGTNYILGYDADKLEAAVKRNIVSMIRTGEELKQLYRKQDVFKKVCTIEQLKLLEYIGINKNTKIYTNNTIVKVDVGNNSARILDKNTGDYIDIDLYNHSLSGTNLKLGRIDTSYPMTTLLEFNTNRTIKDTYHNFTVSYSMIEYDDTDKILNFYNNSNELIITLQVDEVYYTNKLKMSRWILNNVNNNYVMIFKNGKLYDKCNTIIYNDISFAFDFDMNATLNGDKFEFIFFLNANNNVIEALIETKEDEKLKVPKYYISTYKNDDGTEASHKDGYTDGIYNAIGDINIDFDIALPCNTSLFDPENIMVLVNRLHDNKYDINDNSLTNYPLEYSIYSYKDIPKHKLPNEDPNNNTFNYAGEYLQKDEKINGLYRVTKQGGGEYFIGFDGKILHRDMKDSSNYGTVGGVSQGVGGNEDYNTNHTLQPPYIVSICSERQFRYMQVKVNNDYDKNYSCTLNEEFKYCTKESHFMIFKNGLLIPPNFVYLHSIPDTPIQELELCLNIPVKQDDILDIFYVTNGLHHIESDIVDGNIITNTNGQNIKTLASKDSNSDTTSYIRLNSPLYTKGKHLYVTSSKHSLFVFLNGRKVSNDSLEDISDTIIGINNYQPSSDRLEVFDHLDKQDIIEKLYINDGLSHQLDTLSPIKSINLTDLENFTEETKLSKLLDSCTDEQLDALFYDVPPVISPSNPTNINDKNFISRDEVLNNILSKYSVSDKTWIKKM